MQHIHFIDKSFDYVNVTKYHLSLQVSLKGFSFSVLDRDRNKYVALAHYPFSKVTSYRTQARLIGEIFESEQLLQCAFSHVKLLFATASYTFVPSVFYSDDDKSQWFKFNQDLCAGEELMSNYVFGNSSNVVFSVPVVLADLFRSKYPAVKFYHQSVPLIEELTLKSKIEADGRRVLVNVSPTFFDFVLIDGGEIVLFNTFKYKSIADFKYFFLNAIDNLKLSPLTTSVGVSGIVQSDSPIIEFMKEYIRNIGYFEKPSHFEYAYGFNEVPSHYFTNMINLYQCG